MGTTQKKLLDRFGAKINHMSCVYLNNGETVLRDFLEDIPNKKAAIEIGTYQGVSAAIISEYFKKVYTFDILRQDMTKKILDFLEVKNVESYWFDDRNTEKKVAEELIKKHGVNFAFIDGDHKNGAIKKDFEMVKNCKYILVHDYSPAFAEVKDFCDNVKGYKKQIRGVFCLLTKESRRGRKSKKTDE